MSFLDHDAAAPHRMVDSREMGRVRRFALHLDEVEWPNGDRGPYVWIEAPSSSFVVPYFEDGTTVLVRQWRYPWKQTSWEVPAGTIDGDEDPLVCARRELAEEAGLAATNWTPLGSTVGSAVMSNRQHLYLARGLTQVERAPEAYERDMIVRRLPFAEALRAALGGEILHATSVAALARAGAALESS